MKALDKELFDTQSNYRALLVIRISFIEAKRKFLMKKERKQTKTVSKRLQSLQKKSNRIYQSQSEWNIERCIKLQII